MEEIGCTWHIERRNSPGLTSEADNDDDDDENYRKL